MSYPVSYENIPHDRFKTHSFTENDAVILFASDDNVNHGLGQLIQTIARLKDVKNKMVVWAEDLPYEKNSFKDRLEFMGNAPLISVQQVRQINKFLLDNSDKHIISSCSAGVSRSGFVSLFLDIKNGNTDYIKKEHGWDDEDIYSFGRRKDNPGNLNGYHANSQAMYYAVSEGFVTDEEFKSLLKKTEIIYDGGEDIVFWLEIWG